MSAAIAERVWRTDEPPATLLAFHQRLLENTRQARYACRFREKQNWIGGSDYNPCAAALGPLRPELVPKLIEDLCAFCASESLPAVAQAALAHAQFETYHPFADGNGQDRPGTHPARAPPPGPGHPGAAAARLPGPGQPGLGRRSTGSPQPATAGRQRVRTPRLV